MVMFVGFLAGLGLTCFSFLAVYRIGYARGALGYKVEKKGGE